MEDRITPTHSVQEWANRETLVIECVNGFRLVGRQQG